MRMLLIEDDPMVGKAICQSLSDAGISVDWVRDGEAGIEAVLVGGHALVLLDLGLPKLDGVMLLKAVRSFGNTVPILVITARNSLSSRIEGLDLGADDYILKPFDADELMARIRAVLRRHAGHALSIIHTGKITLDVASHEVLYKERAEILPAREFALLYALSERPGTVLSKAQLEERLYGWGDEVESNAIDVLIHYVRRKFDKEIILNMRGVGWHVAKDS